jgi:hypothetical protein
MHFLKDVFMENMLENVHRLYLLMNEDNLGYIYRGNFTDEITENILKLTEANLQQEESRHKIKKRIYSIMVEGLQNITRHQQANEIDIEKIEETYGIFVIQKMDDYYFITTGNVVENKNIPPLKELLDKINSLSKDELKEYYKKVLTEGELSDKGGAGLGLIDMARKSGNKLFYKFREIDDHTSYFYLHTVPVVENSKVDEDKIYDTINNIINIHSLLNENNFLLIFNGEFSQESSVNLLGAIKGHITTSASLKNKLFYVVVEMLQNIVKHGSMTDENSANPGIFVIGEDEKYFYIFTGNFIAKNESKELLDKLERINSYSTDELEVQYSKILFDFNVDDEKKTGLGFIDIRLKSQNKLAFSIKDYNEKLDFLLLGAKINKSHGE